MKINREGIFVVSLLLLGAISQVFLVFIFSWHPIESYIFFRCSRLFQSWSRHPGWGIGNPYIAFSTDWNAARCCSQPLFNLKLKTCIMAPLADKRAVPLFNLAYSS